MENERAPESAPHSDKEEAIGTDLIIPVAACLLTAYYFVSTIDLTWESKATGVVIGVCLLAMCAVHFLRTAIKLAIGKGRLSFGDLLEMRGVNLQRIALLVLTTLFILTIEWTGTTLGLFLLLFSGMWVTGVRSLGQLFGISFAVAATVYVLLIELLSSRLPRGFIENLITSVSGGAG